MRLSCSPLVAVSWSCVPHPLRLSLNTFAGLRTNCTTAPLHHCTEIFRYIFLDRTEIFRLAGIFIFFLPIGIFGIQPAIFRLQKHKFSIKSKILFGYSIFICTFAAQTTSLTINFQTMERKHYSFEGCGSPKIQGVMIYQGWLSESDMAIMAQGIVIGLRQYCKGAFIQVYEEQGENWHLVWLQK